MLQKILFIGGEQDGMYNSVSPTLDKVEIDVYPKLDLRKLTGIIRTLPKPLRHEVYTRRKLTHKDGENFIECFCLKEITDEELRAKLAT